MAKCKELIDLRRLLVNPEKLKLGKNPKEGLVVRILGGDIIVSRYSDKLSSSQEKFKKIKEEIIKEWRNMGLREKISYRERSKGTRMNGYALFCKERFLEIWKNLSQ